MLIPSRSNLSAGDGQTGLLFSAALRLVLGCPFVEPFWLPVTVRFDAGQLRAIQIDSRMGDGGREFIGFRFG